MVSKVRAWRNRAPSLALSRSQRRLCRFCLDRSVKPPPWAESGNRRTLTAMNTAGTFRVSWSSVGSCRRSSPWRTHIERHTPRAGERHAREEAHALCENGGSHYFACESGGCRQREGVHRLCECAQLVVELNRPTQVSYPLSTVRRCVRAPHGKGTWFSTVTV